MADDNRDESNSGGPLTKELCDAEREIVVESDVWIVYEMPPKANGDSSPSLVFSSTKIVRRVRHFPGNWRELTDSALYETSQSV